MLNFILYNLTAVAVILHLYDSAKENEWTEPLYRNNYIAWLIQGVVLTIIALAGIVPVYLKTDFGNYWSIVLGVGGLSGYGYHKITHLLKTSTVCLNQISYMIMWVLNIFSAALIVMAVLELTSG
ncbi:hypothetical protein [Shewanella sp.]|uniref:hypothetical protein n=1 Tax=Shewanella sp. TaxID=50422 RepID=UPI003A97587E